MAHILGILDNYHLSIDKEYLHRWRLEANVN